MIILLDFFVSLLYAGNMPVGNYFLGDAAGKCRHFPSFWWCGVVPVITFGGNFASLLAISRKDATGRCRRTLLNKI